MLRNSGQPHAIRQSALRQCKSIPLWHMLESFQTVKLSTYRPFVFALLFHSFLEKCHGTLAANRSDPNSPSFDESRMDEQGQGQTHLSRVQPRPHPLRISYLVNIMINHHVVIALPTCLIDSRKEQKNNPNILRAENVTGSVGQLRKVVSLSSTLVQ